MRRPHEATTLRLARPLGRLGLQTCLVVPENPHMPLFRRPLSRRTLLAGAAGAALLGPPAMAAAPLRPTPGQTEGPFYPERFPTDSDADLLHVAGRPSPALGEPLDLAGSLLDPVGRPIAGAVVEIWQADANGLYLHSGSWSALRSRDLGFQGFGRITTAADGGYRFRTIRPVPYASRTPHIHFAVRPRGGPALVTQMYVAGEPGNDTDFVLNSIRSPADRSLVVIPLEAAVHADVRWRGRFDIVLG